MWHFCGMWFETQIYLLHERWLIFFHLFIIQYYFVQSQLDSTYIFSRFIGISCIFYYLLYFYMFCGFFLRFLFYVLHIPRTAWHDHVTCIVRVFHSEAKGSNCVCKSLEVKPFCLTTADMQFILIASHFVVMMCEWYVMHHGSKGT